MRNLAAVALLLLAACAPQAEPPPASIDLVPYGTLTPAPFSAGLEWVATAARPLPSPTPFTYTVQAGDTMGGIALKFGVSPQDLQDANPEVSPNSMSIDQVLKIPSDPANPSGEPTPTPAAFSIEQIQCHPDNRGGRWCFVLAHNDTSDIYENVSVQVTLLEEGSLIDSQVAILPLNILPPGTSLPMAVYFPPVIPSDSVPQVQIRTATRLLPGDSRYLPASVNNVRVEVDWEGHTAQVSGQLFLPIESKAAASVWLVATAYDEQGRVVGLRRWEAGNPQPGSSIPFGFAVYGLAGRIKRVDVAVEARP